MSKAKINKDVKSTAKISELKIKRNSGELTPEVIQMCCDQLDEMAKVANEHAKDAFTRKKVTKNLEPMITELRSNPEMLALVCKFADEYEEVIRWNRLIRSKKIPMEVTIAHREVDIAMFRKICDTYHSTYTADIAYMLYNYAYARLPPSSPDKNTSKK